MNFFSKQKSLTLAAAEGVIFAAIWSGSFVATKIALADMHPLWLVQIRLAAAGLVFFLLTRKSTIAFWEKATLRCSLDVILAGLLSHAVYLGGTCWALMMLPTGVVAIIVAALPLVSVPMAFLILKEKITFLDVGAALFGVIGVVIVATERDSSALGYANVLSVPVILTVISVLALAAGNSIIKPYVSPRTIGPICTAQMLVSSVATLPFIFFLHGASDFSISANSLMALLYLVFIGSVTGVFLWLKVLQTFTAKGASAFFLFTPLFSLLIGILFLGEGMTVPKIIGALVVSGSILFNAGNYLFFGKSKVEFE